MALGQYKEGSKKGASPTDAIVVGETLVDIMHKSDGTMSRLPGGSPANVAVGLSRLDRCVTLATHIGNDEGGKALQWFLDQNSVVLADNSLKADVTNTAEASLQSDGSVTYEFKVDPSIPQPLPEVTPETGVVHAGSLCALAADQKNTHLVPYLTAARQHATITFDPNIRPEVMGTPAEALKNVSKFVAVSDVVKLSEEDAKWLAPELDPLQLAQTWLDEKDGPLLVVVTAGQDGIVVLGKEEASAAPAENVSIADTVGAGDAVSAAVIDALWSLDLLGAARRSDLAAADQQTLAAIAVHAAKAAGHAVSKPGADMPKREHLKALSSASSVKVPDSVPVAAAAGQS